MAAAEATMLPLSPDSRPAGHPSAAEHGTAWGRLRVRHGQTVRSSCGVVGNRSPLPASHASNLLPVSSVARCPLLVDVGLSTTAVVTVCCLSQPCLVSGILHSPLHASPLLLARSSKAEDALGRLLQGDVIEEPLVGVAAALQESALALAVIASTLDEALAACRWAAAAD